MPFAPPRHLIPVAGAQAFFIVLMSAVALAALIWAVRRQDWVLCVLLPAAGLSSFIEPTYDTVGVATWSPKSISVFHMYGGHVFNPIIFPLGYMMWVGLGTYFAFWIFDRRWERRRVVRVFLVLALCEPAMEYPWLWTHLLAYQGPQPYKLFGYSILWNAINTAGVAVTGSVLLWLNDSGRTTGRDLRYVAALPFAMIGVYVITGAPGWFVMHIDHAPTLVLWAGGTVTLLIGHQITVACIDWAQGWNARRSVVSDPDGALAALTAERVVIPT